MTKLGRKLYLGPNLTVGFSSSISFFPIFPSSKHYDGDLINSQSLEDTQVGYGLTDEQTNRGRSVSRNIYGNENDNDMYIWKTSRMCKFAANDCDISTPQLTKRSLPLIVHFAIDHLLFVHSSRSLYFVISNYFLHLASEPLVSKCLHGGGRFDLSTARMSENLN